MMACEQIGITTTNHHRTIRVCIALMSKLIKTEHCLTRPTHPRAQTEPYRPAPLGRASRDAHRAQPEQEAQDGRRGRSGQTAEVEGGKGEEEGERDAAGEL